MKLYLKADMENGKKCGHRDPETNKVVRNTVLYPYEGTEVVDKVAKLMLSQNSHIISKEPFVKPEAEASHPLNPIISEAEHTNLRKERDSLKEKLGFLRSENEELLVRIERYKNAAADSNEKSDPGADQESDQKAEAATEVPQPINEELSDKAKSIITPGPALKDLKFNELVERAKKRPDIKLTPGIRKVELVELLETPPITA